MNHTMFALAFAVVLSPATALAQLHVSPLVGIYIPASDLYSLRNEAQDVSVQKEGTFAMGANLEFGMFRASVAYASGAQINERGVQNRDNVGEGKLLAVAGDLVLRPLPRLLVQPYLLLGAGVRRENYSYEDDGVANALPDEQSDFAFHGGIGADLMLGRIGIVAEVTDWITKNQSDDFQHDAFGFVGLRLRLGN